MLRIAIVASLLAAVAPAQAARFHVPTIPSFRISGVPVRPAFAVPVRPVVVPPTAPSVAAFLAGKRR
jgi:hypothetical protein